MVHISHEICVFHLHPAALILRNGNQRHFGEFIPKAGEFIAVQALTAQRNVMGVQARVHVQQREIPVRMRVNDVEVAGTFVHLA